MKLLVKLVLLGIAASIIINTLISTVVEAGGGSLGLNASRLFTQGGMGDYWDGDEEYGDYDDEYGNGDYGDGELNGEGTVSSRNEGRSRRGSFGVSSQFWGQVFNIHTHYHKVVGVNWDQDQDECSALGTGCSSRQPCCKGSICKQWKCAQCVGDYGSCPTVKNCCRPDQKCIDNKCTDWCAPIHGRCAKPSLPCCNGAYRCQAQTCKIRRNACAANNSKTCSPTEYPCCDQLNRCIDGKCQQCRAQTEPCKEETDCCTPGARCISGFCQKSKKDWGKLG